MNDLHKIRYAVVGLGHIAQVAVLPAFLSYEISVDGRTTQHNSAKRDQFAPELIYFSRCILEDTEPEPSGEEGLQDVRIINALYESADAGKPIQLPPYRPASRPDPSQQIRRPPVSEPDVIKAPAPHS